MNLKNIYKNKILRLIVVIILCLSAIIVAIALNDDKNQIRFVYHLYLIVSLSLFAIAYSDMADITTLGFGVTRFEIFRKFNINLLYTLFSLFIFSLYYNTLFYYAKDINSFNFGLILFLSIVIIFSGQLGMLLGNLRVNKYLSGFVSTLILLGTILEVYIFNNKLFINIVLIISSVLLIFINYALIKNINIEKHL